MVMPNERANGEKDTEGKRRTEEETERERERGRSTIGMGQLPRISCRNGGVDLRRRVADWAVHVFREHNKEDDFWAGKGVKGREEEWTDTAKVIWSDVTGFCGFGDGSCERSTCGAGTMIQVFTKTLGWATVQKKKCGPVLGGCGMLMECLSRWIDKSLHEQLML